MFLTMLFGNLVLADEVMSKLESQWEELDQQFLDEFDLSAHNA